LETVHPSTFLKLVLARVTTASLPETQWGQPRAKTQSLKMYIGE